MRLDRFLKLSRVVKRELRPGDDNPWLRVGGAPVRSSKGLKPGDIIEVAFPEEGPDHQGHFRG